MLSISKAALNKLRKVLEEHNLTSGGIRLGVRGSGNCALSFYLGIQKEPLAGDSIIKYEDINIFMDQISIDKLADIELDYLENPVKTGFVFRDFDSPGEENLKNCQL
jgi:iron-sulfur cluster assembly protein